MSTPSSRCRSATSSSCLVFTIPKVLRPLFERERRLLSILIQSAHHCVQEILRHDTGDARAVVGTVASLQTFGGWFLVRAANFHPHVHALITEGVFHEPRSATASFEWVAGWDATAIAELFRRRVLARLRQARRLREHTEQILLSWEHSAFSVWAGEPIRPGDTERKEHVARYVTRAPVRLDAIERKDQGKVLVQAPYDPRTGQRTLELDDLELIRRLCAQIPAPRQHLVRYFGWYSSRARGDRGRRKSEESGNGAPRSEVDVRADPEAHDDAPAARSRRRSWARPRESSRAGSSRSTRCSARAMAGAAPGSGSLRPRETTTRRIDRLHSGWKFHRLDGHYLAFGRTNSCDWTKNG